MRFRSSLLEIGPHLRCITTALQSEACGQIKVDILWVFFFLFKKLKCKKVLYTASAENEERQSLKKMMSHAKMKMYS